MQSFGKYLIIIGAVVLAAGLLFTLFPKTNLLGRLPGDIELKRENITFYFPIVTSILLSVGISLVFWLINYFSRK